MTAGGGGKAEPEFSVAQTGSPLNMRCVKAPLRRSAPLGAAPCKGGLRLAVKLAGHGDQGTGDHSVGVIDGVVSGIEDEAVDTDSQEKTARVLPRLAEPVAQPCRQPAPEPDPVPDEADIQVHAEKIIVNLGLGEQGDGLHRPGEPLYHAFKPRALTHVGKADFIVGRHIGKQQRPALGVQPKLCLQIVKEAVADPCDVEKANHHHGNGHTRRCLSGGPVRHQTQKQRRRKGQGQSGKRDPLQSNQTEE